MGAILALAGCSKPAPPPAAPQAMPVQVAPVSLSPVANSDTYVATIKSRRSATMQPQVDGNLTRIFVHSGDARQGGPGADADRPAQAGRHRPAAAGNRGAAEGRLPVQPGRRRTPAQALRGRHHLKAGLRSGRAGLQELQGRLSTPPPRRPTPSASSSPTTRSARPSPAVVGDIPVHLGDYVSPTTVLTTVDENSRPRSLHLHPDRARRAGPHGPAGRDPRHRRHRLAHSTIDFISPQVDNGLQSILAKAAGPSRRRASAQRSSSSTPASPGAPRPRRPSPCSPSPASAARLRLRRQPPRATATSRTRSPVSLGEPSGNNYPVLAGLKPGDRVILSGLQFLQEGAPVKPLG